MISIGNIYLAWRTGRGGRRHIVGVLRKNVTEGIRFEYLNERISQAMKDGFTPYVDFPDFNKKYSEGVLEIFGQRLIKAERTDTKKFYDFWEIDPDKANDVYYMLALTQGILSTDNFEFLADFNPTRDLCFVTEICGLTERKHKPDIISIGEELRWQKEPQNQFDQSAIQVLKGDTLIGYVKKVHNRVFSKYQKERLKIVVKSIDQNGSVNRVFIRVSF